MWEQMMGYMIIKTTENEIGCLLHVMCHENVNSRKSDCLCASTLFSFFFSYSVFMFLFFVWILDLVSWIFCFFSLHTCTVLHFTHSARHIDYVSKSILCEYITCSRAAVTVGAIHDDLFILICIKR